MFSYILYPIVK